MENDELEGIYDFDYKSPAFTQVDGYPEFRASKENGLHIIRIGSERYEIPDAIILNG